MTNREGEINLAINLINSILTEYSLRLTVNKKRNCLVIKDCKSGKEYAILDKESEVQSE